MQRLLVVQDKREGRAMFFTHALLYLAFWVVLYILVISVLHHAPNLTFGKNDKGVVMGYVLEWLGSSVGKTLLLAGILAAILSTADSFVSALGLIAVYDVALPLLALQGVKVQEKRVVQSIRIATFVGGVIAMTLPMMGWRVDQLHDLFYGFAHLLTIPLVVPLLGLKVRLRDLLIYTVAYVGALLGVVYILRSTPTYESMEFQNAIPRVVAGIAGFVVMLLAHLVEYRGLRVVVRGHGSVHEQLWLPSNSELVAKLRAYLEALKELPDTAITCFRHHGGDPFVVGLLLLLAYMVPAYYTGEDLALHSGTALLVVRMVAMSLIAGLWTASVWPSRARYYFPLYYYLSIGFALPFAVTLNLLLAPQGALPWVQWCLMLLALFCLADHTVMLHLLLGGMVLALFSCKFLVGSFLPTMVPEQLYLCLYMLLASGFILLALAYKKEQSMYHQIRKAKALGTSISHETNNYLNIAKSGGDALEFMLERRPATVHEHKDGTHTYELHGKIYNQVQFLASTLGKGGEQTNNKISLFVDALRNERFDVQMDTHQLSKCVQDAVKDIFFEEENVQKRVHYALEEDFAIYCSAPFFNHIIYNLVRNAMHHGHANTITITAHAKARTLEIHDDGKGIPAERLPRIFDLFYTSSKNPFGIRQGIGLALVREIVRSWGAQISVRTQQGEGHYTSFEIVFPEVEG